VNWIEEFRIKTYAAYSPVALVNTNDPKRVEQFTLWAIGEFNKVFHFDLFHGLRLIKKTETAIDFEPIKTQTSNPLSLSASNIIIDPIQALHYFHDLQEKKYCLIMEIPSIKPEVLWDLAKDPELFLHEHSIVVFSPNISSIPEYVKDICINVEPPISTLEERKEILKGISKTFKVKTNGKHANALAGLNLHQSQSVLLESIAKNKKLSLDIIAEYKKEIIKRSGVLEILTPLKKGFEEIGGYELVKDFVSNNIIKPLLNPDKARQLGLRLPRGLLLFGPPGTGKTLFARGLAKELQLPAIELLTENIFSKYVGESESNLKKALKLIDEISPCIVFIDEVDRLGNRSETGGDAGTSRRVFGQLLSWLGKKERQAIIIATTNTPGDLDFAFKRAGRFDYKIPFLYPDEDARLAILRVHTSIQRNVPLGKVDLKEVARATQYYSGAELEELVIRAIRVAFRQNVDLVTQEHFDIALDSFRINFSERQQQMQNYLEMAEQLTDDAQFLAKLKQTYADRIELLKQKLGV